MKNIYNIKYLKLNRFKLIKYQKLKMQINKINN